MKPTMSREQFEHICAILRNQKKAPTPENIVEYMKSKKHQKSKFYKRLAEEEAEKVNQEREKWAFYLSTIQFRIKIFEWHLVWHKKGYKGRWGRFDIIKARSSFSGDSN